MKPGPDQPLAGVLEPVFAIRTENDLGIGDTEGVRQMIDWCHRHRLNIFQTLPINEIGEGHSPYQAISALAIDPLTIHISPRAIPDLPRPACNRIARPRLLRDLREGPVNYPKVKALKHALLQSAFDNFYSRHFNPGTARARRFCEFMAVHSNWLQEYALFRVLMEENAAGAAWDKWLPEHRTPPQARAWLLSLSEKRRVALVRRQLYFMYVQWLAYSQWEALKIYAGTKKVWLMGDVSFGVARSSADVWANRAIFDLDWYGGAPPEAFFKNDPFTVKWGQNWGVPNYRWEELHRRDFDWWRIRLGNIQRTFHFYRIDHVLGFFRIYSFPWPPERNREFASLNEHQAAALTKGRLPGFKPFPDDTVEHKAANQHQGESLLRFVLEASGNTNVVAEDLGMVPDYVPATLCQLGIPGFRIPAFFREPDGRYSDPAKYPRLSLAQPATHDHPPLAATWNDHWRHIDNGHEVEHNLRELRHILEFAGIDEEDLPREFTGRMQEAYLRALLRSNSWLAIVMITDVFGFDLRFNTPGTSGGQNWSLRLPGTVTELEENPGWQARANGFSRLAREANRGV